jgi:DNA invertase Pin-like site-specific DNA recombinase
MDLPRWRTRAGNGQDGGGLSAGEHGAAGQERLGLEAQRQAVEAEAFATAHGFTIASEFVEAETGKSSDALERRPQLAAALQAARKLGKGTPILVAKLDRLSRVRRSSPT